MAHERWLFLTGMDPTPSQALEVRSVRKTYGEGEAQVVAVDGVSLTVGAGEFVALMGASGCGKSTLLHVVAGLLEGAEGEVEVFGQQMVGRSERERTALRLKDVGVVFQDHLLVPELTAVENVELPLVMAGTPRAQAREQAVAMLARVGLEGLEDRVPDRMSGGQRQRVGIARAMVGGRRVLLADEPTGNLDTDSSRAVVGLVRQLCADGVAALVVTHDPRVAGAADRVLHMEDGRFVEQPSAWGQW